MCLVKCSLVLSTLLSVHDVGCVTFACSVAVRCGEKLICLVCACKCGICGAKCILLGV